MAKNDWKKISVDLAASPPSEAKALVSTKAWLTDQGNIERLLETVANGLSLRRFCESEGVSYSTVQRRLSQDDLRPLYYQAQEDQAEHLLGEMERVTKALEGVGPDGQELWRDEVIVAKDGRQTTVRVRDCMDPKAASVILDSIKWRLSKFNAKRYSDRQVIEQHTYDHTKAHMEAVRSLARQPRLTRTELARLDHQADRDPIDIPSDAVITRVTSVEHRDHSHPGDHTQPGTTSATSAALAASATSAASAASEAAAHKSGPGGPGEE